MTGLAGSCHMLGSIPVLLPAPPRSLHHAAWVSHLCPAACPLQAFHVLFLHAHHHQHSMQHPSHPRTQIRPCLICKPFPPAASSQAGLGGFLLWAPTSAPHTYPHRSMMLCAFPTALPTCQFVPSKGYIEFTLASLEPSPK